MGIEQRTIPCDIDLTLVCVCFFPAFAAAAAPELLPHTAVAVMAYDTVFVSPRHPLFPPFGFILRILQRPSLSLFFLIYSQYIYRGMAVSYVVP